MPLSIESVSQIAARHGLAGELAPLPKGGLVNDAWQIGERLILRVCQRDGGRDEAEREAAVAPLLDEAGLRTPKLMAADPAGDFMGWPYTIYEKAEGEVMGYCGGEPARFEDAYRQLGREAAILHRIEVPDRVRPMLRTIGPFDAVKAIAEAREDFVLPAAELDEIEAWFASVQSAFEGTVPLCLVHNDLHPWNVFVAPDEDRLTAIIDWGDASWGDPATEFGSPPMAALEPMLDGYRAAGGTVDETFVVRALAWGLREALWEVGSLPEEEFDRRWWRMPSGGWEEMKEWIRRLTPGQTTNERRQR